MAQRMERMEFVGDKDLEQIFCSLKKEWHNCVMGVRTSSTPGTDFFHSIAGDDEFIKDLIVANRSFFLIPTLTEKLRRIVKRMESNGEEFSYEAKQKMKARILKQVSRDSFVGIHVKNNQERNGYKVPEGLKTTLRESFLNLVKHKNDFEGPMPVA